jgi:flavin-dependent dehydrogenase
MIGDTAGLIHPFGNGMAMAIHSAKLATENTIHFLENRIDRSTLENNLNDWKILKKRLQQVVLGKLLQHEKTAQAVFKILIIFPLYYL